MSITSVIGNVRKGLLTFREETGQSPVIWAGIALLSLFTQIILHRELLPGEFGTFNTALGVIGLMTVPVIALVQTFNWHFVYKRVPGQEQRFQEIRSSELAVIETITWVWAIISGVLLLIGLPLLELPRYSVNLLVLLNVLLALGALLSGAMYCSGGRRRTWVWLLVGAAVARLVLGITMSWYERWAEAALVAFLFAGLITLAPALRSTETSLAERFKALKTVLDGAFLIDPGAIFRVLLGIYLFTNGDRIVAQSWFGTAADNNIGYVDWPMFDAYQTAGLLGRSILWGTQPLLLMLFIRRARVDRTTASSLDWFWLYLGALVTGVTLVNLFHVPLSRLFCGADYFRTAHLVPVFTITMIPLGLLQGIGMFSLASRRYPECFVFGVCSIGYAVVLYLAGRNPQIMPAYMFGGSLVSLMAVLFVGVVRWGRKQP